MIYKVFKIENTANIVWDQEKNRPLCKFTEGVFLTNNEKLADKLGEMGYTVKKMIEPEKEEYIKEPEKEPETPDIPEEPEVEPEKEPEKKRKRK